MEETVGGSSDAHVADRAAQHEQLVEHVVTETMRRVPASVTREELMSSGLAALAAASRVHEDADGDFTRFASARIRAAVVDTLQAIDWQARGQRRREPASSARLNQVQQAVTMLSGDRRAVIEGYFLDQRSLPDLAADLEVDEQQVAHLHTDALLALRRTLGPVFAADAQLSGSPESPESPRSSGSSGTGSPRTLNLR